MEETSPGNRLRWLPYLYAAGAIFWLIELTQFAAVLAAPVGRQQLMQTLANAGFASNAGSMLVVESVLIAFVELTAGALHAAAYYGLRRFRPWGWVAAVIVAGAWSLLLVGIPIFVFLLRRQTRAAYGVP
ncbi:MAG TPA: hypothetical protein VJR46_00375 [Candidatus Dormibacteraeota bacterium]|nr:hypothetical protein [Candidatus Dormibacteraeota bacterium]